MNNLPFNKLVSLYIKKYNLLCNDNKDVIMFIKVGSFYEAFSFANMLPDLSKLCDKFNTTISELKFLTKFFNAVPKVISISEHTLMEHFNVTDNLYLYELNEHNELCDIKMKFITNYTKQISNVSPNKTETI